MIHFEDSEENKREYLMKRDGNDIVKLDLLSSSITNKFFIISDYISGMSSKHGIDFDEWLEDLIISIIPPDDGKDKKKKEITIDEDNSRLDIIMKNIPKLNYFSDSYIDILNVDYSEFVDETKKKKNSILFLTSEIEDIIKLSGRLKIYSLIFNSNLKLIDPLHRRIYNEIISDVVSKDLTNKLFSVVKIKTYRYNLTDKKMWSYIKKVKSMSIDDHIIGVFNFIMDKIIVLCVPDRNPIVYFTTVVDESARWLLKGIYGDVITYDDTISTQDTYTTSGVNNLRAMFYNDTLARLKIIAEREVSDMTSKSSVFDDKSLEFNSDAEEYIERVAANIEFISPLCECMVFPLLSRITGIPYRHFMTLNADQSAYLSVLVYRLMKKVFGNRFSNLVELLLFYPITQPPIATTYQIKDSDVFVNIQNKSRFFTFRSQFITNIIRYYTGRISRCDFSNIITDENLASNPTGKIEEDIIEFFMVLFDNKLEKEIYQMTRILESMF